MSYGHFLDTMNDKSSVLLKIFDEEIHVALGSFMAQNNAKEAMGKFILNDHGPADIKFENYDSFNGIFFLWIHRFEMKDVILDINFGDRESIVEPILYFKRINERFAPWEILLSSGVTNPLAASGEMWVLKVDFMKEVIRRMSIGIKEHWAILSNPGESLIQQTLLLREKRMAAIQEEDHGKDRERASIKAMDAFHSGKYAEAVKLLEPFKDDPDISKSSIMLFGLAKKRLLS